jgi:hypothetical protein
LLSSPPAINNKNSKSNKQWTSKQNIVYIP